MKTTRFVLRSAIGTVQTLKFADYDDNPEKGRVKAYAATLRAQEGWLHNAPHLFGESPTLTLTEE